MEKNLDTIINLIKNCNTDDARFIINIYDAYQKHQKQVLEKIKATSIITKNDFSKTLSNIVDLDLIWCKPYFYTKMRLHLDTILERLLNADISQISKNTSQFCKNLSLCNSYKKFNKPDNEIDIVDFIKSLNQNKLNNSNYNTQFIFIADKIDEETLFKEEQIKKAIDIINTNSAKEQLEKIYKEVYFYLKNDFVANSYCDFHNNKCVAQRHFRFFPLNIKNGCCFTRIKSCSHLQQDGSCNVECMACRLFSCPYLSKRGITYYASEFVLLKAFLNKKQRKHLVFDFYTPKGKVLSRISKFS